VSKSALEQEMEKIFSLPAGAKGCYQPGPALIRGASPGASSARIDAVGLVIKVALRLAIRSGRSRSFQHSAGSLGGRFERIVGQIECEGAMLLAFFSPALGESFRCYIVGPVT